MKVVRDHRTVLGACDNITGNIVAQWAKIMCLPQFAVAPVLGCLGYPLSGLLFVTRITAMLVVGELDKRIEYTRALGLCHLVTFGPLYFYLLSKDKWGWNPSPGAPPLDIFEAGFIWVEMRITNLCLLMDTRDLILHLFGYKYPCYIREAVQVKKLEVKDIMAAKPATWWNRIVGP